MKKLVQNFIHCGTLGWCMEITFTALHSLRCREYTLKGNTSLYMFPIYGLAAFLSPVCKILKGKPVVLRGLTYAGLIFSVEYAAGSLLSRKGVCPWDYSHAKWNINRVIRLDYLPFWAGAGLLFEKLLQKNAS